MQLRSVMLQAHMLAQSRRLRWKELQAEASSVVRLLGHMLACARLLHMAQHDEVASIYSLSR